MQNLSQDSQSPGQDLNQGPGPGHTWERREKCTRFWWESLKKRDHPEDHGIDGRMGSERILRQTGWGGGLVSTGSEYGLVPNCCKCGDEPLDCGTTELVMLQTVSCKVAGCGRHAPCCECVALTTLIKNEVVISRNIPVCSDNLIQLTSKQSTYHITFKKSKPRLGNINPIHENCNGINRTVRTISSKLLEIQPKTNQIPLYLKTRECSLLLTTIQAKYTHTLDQKLNICGNAR
jgi:hypothetical protein